jgi:MFS family permease
VSLPGRRQPEPIDGRASDPDGEASRAPDHEAASSPPQPSRRSRYSLDWFVFFVADLQTGFGPFVAVYLTTQKWTQVDIGLVLTAGGLVALLGQVPGGALVDAVRSVRVAAGVAVAVIAASALAYALRPFFPVVLGAAALHAAASCVLGPAIAAMSLGLVGYGAIGERLGRNARCASIGAGLSAAGMGACGYFFSARSVFFVTAALLLPTLFALSRIVAAEIDRDRARGAVPQPVADVPEAAPVKRLDRRRLLIFGACMMLFHLANAAMLPLMGSVLTTRSGQWATVLIAACIVVPQIIVALFSPWVGRLAERVGRRPLLIVAFGVLPLRAVLFASVTDPYLLVGVQVLDGITAAIFSVMVPLSIADITRGTGRFNLTQGMIGMMVGIGASLSPTFAGLISDHFSSAFAFLGLALIALIGFTTVTLFMPETRPAHSHLSTRGAGGEGGTPAAGVAG